MNAKLDGLSTFLRGLAAMASITLLIALDPDAARRGTTLQEVWPILIVYLAAGPLVGWLASRMRERERELLSTVRQLHVVQEIAQAINASLDLEQTLHSIIAETHRLVAFERAIVLLREDESLRVVAISESDDRRSALMGKVFDVKGTASGRVVRRRQTWAAGSAELAKYPDYRAICPPDTSCMLIPLQYKQAVIGVFVLAGEALEVLPAAEKENLGRIAGQIAIAIEYARCSSCNESVLEL